MPRTTPLAAVPANLPLLRCGSLDEFRSVVDRSFVPLAVSSRQPHHFHATVHGQTLQSIGLTEIAADAHVVERTRRLCETGDQAPSYKVSLMLDGSAYLCQDGRDVVLGPGDLAIYDTARPYTLAFDDSFRSVVAIFPKRLVDLDDTRVGKLTATAFGTGDPLGDMVASMLTQVTGRLGGVTGTVGWRLARNMVDLVSILLREQLGEQLDAAPEGTVDRILDVIDERLSDPALSPSSIADEHFISVRYLHVLFQSRGITVASHIRRERLERCRLDLADPQFHDQTVTQIASRWTFTDAAHFSRMFKTAYGMTPTAFRESLARTAS